MRSSDASSFVPLHFVSFDPRCPEHLRLFVRRVPRDTALILAIESEVAAFHAEVEAKIAALAQRYEAAA